MAWIDDCSYRLIMEYLFNRINFSKEHRKQLQYSYVLLILFGNLKIILRDTKFKLVPTKIDVLFYAAAATTAIAGIIHLVLGIPSNNQNSQILFVVGGIAQIFWVIPTIRKWGNIWNLVGIGGTGVFVAIWVITRIPENFITGRGGRISENGILTEVFQIAFIAIMIAILVLSKRNQLQNKP